MIGIKLIVSPLAPILPRLKRRTRPFCPFQHVRNHIDSRRGPAVRSPHAGQFPRSWMLRGIDMCAWMTPDRSRHHGKDAMTSQTPSVPTRSFAPVLPVLLVFACFFWAFASTLADLAHVWRT